MKVGIIVVGDRKTAIYLRKIKVTIPKAVGRGRKEIAEKMAKKAKSYAPVATGDLRDSIKIMELENTHFIVAGAGLPRGYGLAQERSFEPHYVHTSTIDARVRAQYQDITGDRFIFVRKFTPFMGPAFRSVLGEVGKTVKKHISRAMKRRA